MNVIQDTQHAARQLPRGAWSEPQWTIPADALRFEVLRTPRQRMKIAKLRELSAFGVEQDLCLGLAASEKMRDEIGLVSAVCSGDRVLATLRFVPAGLGLTGAERLHQRQRFDDAILGEGSWEIGRVIMAPEDRHPDLLLRCMQVAMRGLLHLHDLDVRRFHATTTLAMSRLWRRFGMRAVLTTEGESGTRYSLVHGLVEDAADAIGVELCYEAPAC